MAKFSPIAENFTPAGTIEEVDWNQALTIPATGYVDTDVSGFFKPPTADEPYTFPSVRGSAISVQDSLANITFVEGSAGEMSATIAYIRYWSRNGTTQKTVVGSAATDNVVSDPQEALLSQINTLSYGTDLDLSGVISPAPPRTVLTIPTNTAYQSRPRQPVPTTTTTTSPPPTDPSFLNRLGSIFSANPGGAAAPAWANPFYTPSAAPDPDGAVWQFLFNPEELQLSSGPDFNRAETWGVSDPANSGQPLSWRSNRNRKLSFGKVLLHGYTFGKRVDSLESGLQQLFMAREGEGMDGPPVLEFVWGQRVFGPCVIQNIQVREKAWDKGLLVNAEVSFELEQVPEWTINDGFVDVLRPGRQSTINDPLLPSNQDVGGTTTDRDTPPPPPPRTAPDTSPQSNLDPNLCNFAVRQSKLFQQFFERVDSPLIAAAFGDYGSIRKNFLDLKRNFYSGSSEIGKFVDSKLSSFPGCRNGSYDLTISNLENFGGNLAISPQQNAVQFMRACSRDTKSGIDEWQRTSPKCKSQRVAGQQSRIADQINKQCEQIKPGKSCAGSLNLSERTISTCNNGKTVVCIRGTWELKFPRG